MSARAAERFREAIPSTTQTARPANEIAPMTAPAITSIMPVNPRIESVLSLVADVWACWDDTGVWVGGGWTGVGGAAAPLAAVGVAADLAVAGEDAGELGIAGGIVVGASASVGAPVRAGDGEGDRVKAAVAVAVGAVVGRTPGAGLAVAVGAGREAVGKACSVGVGVEVGVGVSGIVGKRVRVAGGVCVGKGVHTGVWALVDAVRCIRMLVPLCQTAVWLAGTPPISK